MSCEKIQCLLNDYVDNELPVLHVEVVRKHCDSCETCASKLEGLMALKLALKTLPVPQPSQGFEKRVIKAAIQDASSAERMAGKQGSLVKFAVAAMISAVALWAGLFYQSSGIDESQVFVKVGNEVRTIKVAIDADKPLEAVSLRVDLSDNLELAGFGSKKQITWNADLHKGVNIISLPIIGIAQGKGDVTTRIRLNGKEKIMRIQTQYTPPGSVLYDDGSMLQS
jgi:hypothetical protein